MAQQPTRTRKMASNSGNSKVPNRQSDRTLRYKRRTVKESDSPTVPNQKTLYIHQTNEYSKTEAQQNTSPKESWDEQ
ncbi:4153_t:CDS:2, partial [Acaulospora morrowiae]